mgnify:CR=1 FL=1
MYLTPSSPPKMELHCTCCAKDVTHGCNHKLLVVQRVDAALGDSIDAGGSVVGGVDVSQSLIPDVDCTPERPFGKASLVYTSQRGGGNAVSFFASFVKAPAIVKVSTAPEGPVYQCSTSGHEARSKKGQAELRGGSSRVPCVHKLHVCECCEDNIKDLKAKSDTLPVHDEVGGILTLKPCGV